MKDLNAKLVDGWINLEDDMTPDMEDNSHAIAKLVYSFLLNSKEYSKDIKEDTQYFGEEIDYVSSVNDFICDMPSHELAQISEDLIKSNNLK